MRACVSVSVWSYRGINLAGKQRAGFVLLLVNVLCKFTGNLILMALNRRVAEFHMRLTF